MNLLVGIIWLCFSLTFLIVNIRDDFEPAFFFPLAFICILLISAPTVAAYVLKVKSSPRLELVGLVLNGFLLMAFIALYVYVFTGDESMRKKELTYILPLPFLLIGLPTAISVRALRQQRR